MLWASQSLTSGFQPVRGLRAHDQHVVTILHLLGVLASAEQLEETGDIVFRVPLGGPRIL